MDPIAPLQDDTEADSATGCGMTAKAVSEKTFFSRLSSFVSRLSLMQRTGIHIFACVD